MTSQVEALTKQLETNKALVERAARVAKLMTNTEFRELIIEGFCRDETARFTHISTDPRLDPDDRRDALGSAQAAGYLLRYLKVFEQIGETASNQIPEIEEMLEEARLEEDA